MAIARVIKKRIRSTKNIKQITKAMQAVAAVKMRRSEEVALAARPFAYAALQILKNVVGHSGEHAVLSPLLATREVSKKICCVVITSDKGLAGSFNANVLRASDAFLKKNSSTVVDVVAVGKKGRDHYARRGTTIAREFLGIGDSVSVEETKPISSFIQDVFVSGAYDEVHIVYTNFISALKQDVVSRKILPFTADTLEEVVAGIRPLAGKYSDKGTEGAVHAEYLFEPSPQSVLHGLLSSLLDIEIYHAVLEANASEHSSRMVAMKNASENASELIDSLTILYNKSRQAQITKELTEITAGTEALAVAS